MTEFNLSHLKEHLHFPIFTVAAVLWFVVFFGFVLLACYVQMSIEKTAKKLVNEVLLACKDENEDSFELASLYQQEFNIPIKGLFYMNMMMTAQVMVKQL